LIKVEDGGMRVVIEVDGDVGVRRRGKDTLELLFGGGRDRSVDFLYAGFALGNELEVDHGNVWRGNADGDAVELAGEFRQHQADGLGGTRGGRDHRQCGSA